MSDTKTTVASSPQEASDIQALVAASGHTEADAILILDALMSAGWVLRPLPIRQ